jgi:hypothetical protein
MSPIYDKPLIHDQLHGFPMNLKVYALPGVTDRLSFWDNIPHLCLPLFVKSPSDSLSLGLSRFLRHRP